jgi:hypothetical protein
MAVGNDPKGPRHECICMIFLFLFFIIDYVHLLNI